MRNAAAWAAKIAANVARDRDTDSRLDEEGWRVVRIWSHEAVDDAAERVIEALGRPTATRVGGSS